MPGTQKKRCAKAKKKCEENRVTCQTTQSCVSLHVLSIKQVVIDQGTQTPEAEVSHASTMTDSELGPKCTQFSIETQTAMLTTNEEGVQCSPELADASTEMEEISSSSAATQVCFKYTHIFHVSNTTFCRLQCLKNTLQVRKTVEHITKHVTPSAVCEHFTSSDPTVMLLSQFPEAAVQVRH